MQMYFAQCDWSSVSPPQAILALFIKIPEPLYLPWDLAVRRELVVTRQSDSKILYENTFVTRHQINEQSVALVTAAGRCRWKTENENHNVLKTKGYHLEHNFGHGQAHLAAGLLTLNLLAFLFHTVFHLTDRSYQQIRQKRGTRKGFFQDIVSLTKYLLFENWQSLIDFMLYGSPPPQAANSS